MQEQLHRVVEGLECSVAKQQLHAIIDELNDEQAHKTLDRMSSMRDFLEKRGLYM